MKKTKLTKEELIAKLSLALSMQVPKAIEKDGFLRFLSAEQIVTKVIDDYGITDERLNSNDWPTSV
jgi:hypothetical protein